MTFTYVALALHSSSVLHSEDASNPIKTFTHGDGNGLRFGVRNDREFAWFALDGIDPIKPLTINDAIRDDWYEVA